MAPTPRRNEEKKGKKKKKRTKANSPSVATSSILLLAPKSASFTTPLEPTRQFAPLTSRCAMP